MNSRYRAPIHVPTAFMESMDSFPSVSAPEPPSLTCLPDITVTSEQFTALKLHSAPESRSFLLLDGDEYLKVSSAVKFANRLGCPEPSSKVKVVSIVGNSGDGKSFTLNKIFFQGEEIFQTSNEQNSCTMGVWAAFDPCLNVIVLDTEGLLGSTSREVQRTRLLLKILAVSDIVIYRTRAERLHADMFKFLGSASQAFTRHFRTALGSVNSRGGFGGTLSVLGPAVIIFHETRHTQPLRGSATETVEDVLRSYFLGFKLKTDAFSSLRYIGTQTKEATDFSNLRKVLCAELNNTSVRSARQTDIVFQALKVLNDKFSGEVQDPQPAFFPDEYFTCASKCLSCGRRCEASMGHPKDGLPHACQDRCCFQAQYNNILYTCKACHMSKGKQVIVTPSEPSWLGLAKHAWSGYTINCPYCGEIYRSRQYWYGNKDPEDTVVRTEITHVWPGSNAHTANSQNTAQKVLDGVTFLSEAVASVGSQPTRYISSRMADLIAPKYWRPNHEIQNCYLCKKGFTDVETKHHCRACGEGFCDSCSSFHRPVPERGWIDSVRVCKTCYKSEKEVEVPANVTDDVEVRARKYGEVVVNTFSSVASVLQYPKDLIKDSARPSYWVPDHEARECAICKQAFGPLLPLHHCRDCGKAVCHPCSSKQRPVPYRGWETPVRVCDACAKED